jgi:CheY-like chemotaxis protein
VTSHQLVLVLVEDDDIDAQAVERAVRRAALAFQVVHFADGDLALDAITRRDPRAPFVLVLDLNMPRLPGLELLELLRCDSLIPDCPVIVLTTSNGDADRARALSLGADAYLTKSDRQAMSRLVEACRQFGAERPPAPADASPEGANAKESAFGP